MAIKLINEAGGQFHGMHIIYEGRDASGETAVQENITCWIFQNFSGAIKPTMEDLKGKAEEIKQYLSKIKGLKKDLIEKIMADESWWISWMAQLETWNTFTASHQWTSDYKFYQHDTEMDTDKTIANAIQKCAKAFGVKKDVLEKADIWAIEEDFDEKKAASDLYSIIEGVSAKKDMATAQIAAKAVGQKFVDWFNRGKVIGISLKKISSKSATSVYNVEATHEHDIVDFSEIAYDGLNKMLNPKFKNSDFVPGGGEDKHIHKSTGINYKMTDTIVEGDELKKITRKLKLNVRSGDFQKCLLFVEMAAGGKATSSDGSEISVPAAQLGKLGSWMSQFTGKDESKFDETSLQKNYNKLFDATNFIGSVLKSKYGELPLAPIPQEGGYSLAEDLKKKASARTNYGKWYTLMNKVLETYNAMNTAIENIRKDPKNQGLTNEDALCKLLVYTYLAAKGVNNDFSLVQACPYVLLGN